MIPAKPTPDEARRIEALRQYAVLDTLPEQALDDLTALAAQICGTPIALISLVDDNRQWFKSKVGLDMTETPRDVSFCGHTVHQRDLLVVPDATQDERFVQNPMVTGEPRIRFYAGAPLVNPEGAALGALCVIDHVPRTLTKVQEQALGVLSRQVMTHLELRRQTRELVESEGRLRRLAAIVEFSDDAIIGKDLNSIITSWNNSAERIFGYTADEMVGTSIMRLIPADRQDEENQILGKIKCGESVKHFETLRQTKNGHLINVSVTASPIKDATGKPIGVSKVARDITERIQAEEAHRVSEARYHDLFEYAPDGIVNVNPEGYYIDANFSMCQMLGYTRDELIGLHASDIVAPSEVQ